MRELQNKPSDHAAIRKSQTCFYCLGSVLELASVENIPTDELKQEGY